MTRRIRSCLLASSLLLGTLVAAVGMAPKLAANTIDPVATLTHHGNRVVLTGPIRCTQTERVDLRVIITQRTTGAIAEGQLRFTGSIIEQQWEVVAHVRGEADFESGPATATAIAVTTRHGEATDAHQWLVSVDVQDE